MIDPYFSACQKLRDQLSMRTFVALAFLYRWSCEDEQEEMPERPEPFRLDEPHDLFERGPG